MELIRARALWKSYGENHVLRGIDLDVSIGDLITVRGRSGVGKTTLCRILVLLDEPDRGELTFMDRDVRSLSEDERSRLRMRYIGYVDQHYTLIPWLTVWKNIELPLVLIGMEKSRRIKLVRDVIERLELRGKEDRYPHQLSGGERQRVAIARAIVKNPKLLVCDEPLSNLDDETAAIVIDTLRCLARDKLCGIVVTTTDLSFSLGGRTYLLKRGKLEEV